MSTLRESLPEAQSPDVREAQREAFMRQSIRAALREGFQRIAVVCGAWHAPALEPATMPPAKDDAARLKLLAQGEGASRLGALDPWPSLSRQRLWRGDRLARVVSPSLDGTRPGRQPLDHACRAVAPRARS